MSLPSGGVGKASQQQRVTPTNNKAKTTTQIPRRIMRAVSAPPPRVTVAPDQSAAGTGPDHLWVTKDGRTRSNTRIRCTRMRAYTPATRYTGKQASTIITKSAIRADVSAHRSRHLAPKRQRRQRRRTPAANQTISLRKRMMRAHGLLPRSLSRRRNADRPPRSALDAISRTPHSSTKTQPKARQQARTCRCRGCRRKFHLDPRWRSVNDDTS